MPQPARTQAETDRQAAGSDLSLEQVLAVIRKLDAGARSRVAQALAESEMDARVEQLILRLADKRPVDEVSDAGIQAEVNAVRQARARTPC